MDAGSFLEPELTILRSVWCGWRALESSLSHGGGRRFGPLLVDCYREMLATNLGYNSAVFSRLDSLANTISRFNSLAELYKWAAARLAEKVIGDNGLPVDPYTYWRFTTMLNPYAIWAQWYAERGMPPGDFSRDFLYRHLDVDGDVVDSHVHFESSLYPDEILDIVLRHGFRRVPGFIGYRWFDPNDWKFFPRYALILLSKPLWDKMIMSSFYMFLSIYTYLYFVIPINILAQIRRGILGIYTLNRLMTPYSSWREVISSMVNYLNSNNFRESEAAAFGLILSHAIWASFGDTRVNGLQDFSGKLYSHPLKEWAKSIRTAVLRNAPRNMGAVYQVYRRNLRRRGQNNSVEYRLSFNTRKIEDVVDPILGRLGGGGNTINVGDSGVLLHYIKIDSPVEREKVLRSVLQPAAMNDIVRGWFRETAELFSWLLWNSQNPRRQNLNGLIRGFDAASVEMWTPVWFLAPFFMFWYIGVAGSYSDLLGLKFSKVTFHVGEDFLDIGSGLRRLFDVLLLYDMLSTGLKTRVGHGIALGYNPFTFTEGTASISLFDMVLNTWFVLYVFDTMVNGGTDSILAKIRGSVYPAIYDFWTSLLNKVYGGNVRQVFSTELIRLYPYLFKVFAQVVDLYWPGNSLRKRIWKISNRVNTLAGNADFAVVCSFLRRLVSHQYGREEYVVVPIFPSEILPMEIQDALREGLQNLLLDMVKRQEVDVEICLTSNLLLRGFPNIRAHSLVDVLLDGSFNVRYGTDNPTFTLSTPRLEKSLAMKGGARCAVDRSV